MKITATLVMATLLTTTAFAAPVWAQGVASAPVAATASAPVTAAAMPSADTAQGMDESAQLSPEKAKMYNDAMHQAADDNKELRVRIRKAYDEADAILTAEKFDKNAFLAKAAEIDQLYAKTRERMNQAFISVAEKFSQEDRKILLRARNEHRRHNQQQQQ